MDCVVDKSVENKPSRIHSHLNTFKNNVWELMTVHSKIINKAIEGLASEVKDLKTQLTVTARERDDLIKEVKILRVELKSISQPILTSEHTHHNYGHDVDEPEFEIPNTEESNTNGDRVFSENSDQEIDSLENAIVKQAISKNTKSEDLKSHKGVVHENMEMFMCDKCEYVGSKASNLKRHVAAAHKDNLNVPDDEDANEMNYEPDQGKIIGSSLPFEEVPASAQRKGCIFYKTSDGHLYRIQRPEYLICYHSKDTYDSKVFPKCKASASLKMGRVTLKQPHNHAPDKGLIRKFKRRNKPKSKHQ